MAEPAFKLKGMKQLQAKMRKFGSGALQAAGASLYRSGEGVITSSKENFVPIDTGALRSTLRAHPPQVTGRDVVVLLSAGGPSADYALNVHETNRAYRNGRTWKYLETPLRQKIPTIKANLVSDLRAKFKTI